MKQRAADIWALFILASIVGVFFYKTITSGLLPIPSDTLVGLYHPWRDVYAEQYPRGVPFKNPLITDPIRQQIPWRSTAIDQWKDGRVPGWNPYTLSGQPLVGNIQAAVFQPLNLLFAVLPFASAWSVHIMVQVFLMGAFMYAYVRRLGTSVAVSLLGSVSWAFSGFSIAWLTWGTIIPTAMWLPVLLLAVDNIRRVKKPVAEVSWAGVFAFGAMNMWLSGHMQIAAYMIALALGYALWRNLTLRHWAVIVGGLVIAVLMSSPQWLPFLDAVSQSSRIIDTARVHAPGWFIPWQHLVQFVVPDYFGNPATGNYWGIWNYGEFVGYIGMLPLIAAASLLWSKESSAYRYWVIVLVVGLLLSTSNVISRIPFIAEITFLSSLQPTRYLVAIVFSLVMLAVSGFEALFTQTSLKRISMMMLPVVSVLVIVWMSIVLAPRVGIDEAAAAVAKRNTLYSTLVFLGSAGVLMMASVLRNVRYKQIVMIVVLGIVTVDLVRFGWKFTPFTPEEYFYPETSVTTFLSDQPQPFRVMATDDRLIPPNVLAYYGIESIGGYDPIIPLRYEELIAASERSTPNIEPPFGFNRIVTPKNIDSPLLSLMNVRYVLSLDTLERDDMTLVHEEGQTKVYAYSRALPRVYLADEVTSANDKHDAISSIFSLAQSAVRPAVVETTDGIDVVSATEEDTATIQTYEAHHLEIETRTASQALLVIANTYHTGWQAAVDGEDTPVYRTNYVYQGVVVPEGEHTVVLTFVR